MKMKTVYVALGLAVAIAGCGETSYFDVSVSVDRNVAAVSSTCLFRIFTCNVVVRGAVGDEFSYGRSCQNPIGYNLGVFQYATDKESGDVSFEVTIADANVNPLGQGTSAPTPIKAGGRREVTVTVTPNAALTSACN